MTAFRILTSIKQKCFGNWLYPNAQWDIFEAKLDIAIIISRGTKYPTMQKIRRLKNGNGNT